MRYSIFSVLGQALQGQTGWRPAWREPEPEARLRRRHRRRRRARAGDRLLPRQGARHHQRRGAGEGLARLRQCRAQHHHHPLQLPAARQHPVLRMVAEALGGAGAGHQLQRHGQPARRAQPLPLRRAARRLRAARQRHAAARRRRRTARPRRRARASRRCSTSTMPASRSSGGLLQRRGGTVRHDAVAWGYARAADSAASTSSRTARSPASASRTAGSSASRRRAASSARARSAWPCAGNSSRVAAMAGLRLPIESHVLQAFVSRGREAADRPGHHLRRRALLHQPVRQGRPRLRRRHRRLQLLRPARQPADRRGGAGGGRGR